MGRTQQAAVVPFANLRDANVARQKEWDTGSKIDLSYSGNELAGEAGELIDAALDIIDAGGTDEMALREELGDVVICCDLIAMRLDMVLDTNLSVEPLIQTDATVKDLLLSLAVEVGFVSNTIKKQERERFGMAGARGSLEDLQRNLNEVVRIVHEIGAAMGERVGPCVAAKFNKTSIKVGLQTRMAL